MIHFNIILTLFRVSKRTFSKSFSNQNFIMHSCGRSTFWSHLDSIATFTLLTTIILRSCTNHSVTHYVLSSVLVQNVTICKAKDRKTKKDCNYHNDGHFSSSYLSFKTQRFELTQLSPIDRASICLRTFVTDI
jgi:hypothetical protein